MPGPKGARKAGSRVTVQADRKNAAFRDLKVLPCYAAMDERIKSGVAIEEVARWLQEDMYQELSIKRDSLERKLFRYRAALPPALVKREEPLYIRTAIEKMNRGIDEVKELESLYLVQLRRISMDVKTETQIGKLFNGTSREIALAAEILSRMTSLKMELGILTKVPEQLQIGAVTGIMNIAPEDVDESTKARIGLLAGKLLQAMDHSFATAPAAGVDDHDGAIDIDPDA